MKNTVKGENRYMLAHYLTRGWSLSFFIYGNTQQQTINGLLSVYKLINNGNINYLLVIW